MTDRFAEICASSASDATCMDCPAGDEARKLRARLAEVEAERDRLREALEPFSIFAGSLFAFNCDRADDVASLRGEGGEIVLVAGAFFDARAALAPKGDT